MDTREARLTQMDALGALGAHATWDQAGRLLFNDHGTALRYAQARAFIHRTRHRVTVRTTCVPGFPFHVSQVAERPVQLEAELAEVCS